MAAHKNLFYARRRVAPLRGRLHHDVVLFAIAFELRDCAPTHGGFHCTRNGFHRNTQISGAIPVYFHADFRFVQTQVHVHALNARVFSDFILESFGDFGQVFITVASDDHEVKWSLAKRLAQRWRGDGKRHDTWHS